MASAETDKKLLDFMSENPDHPLTPQGLGKLGLDDKDLKVYQFAIKNPDHPRAVEAKNSVFEKVRDFNPVVQEQGVPFLTRFGLKNLIGNNPELQVKYLEKKGYSAKIKDGQVVVAKPGETIYKVVDPEGLDLFDVTDVLGDIGEIAAATVATGAKFLGSIGAPATGGASLAAGMGAGAAATGGFEAGRQGIGKALGFREEFDPKQIAGAAAGGAAIPLIGAAFSKVARGAKGLGRAVIKSAKLKPEAAAIRAAAKKLGTQASPGQLSGSKLIQGMESSIRQSPYLGGAATRRAAEQQALALKVAAEDITAGPAITKFEAGEVLKKAIPEKFAKKLQPAEFVYDRLEEQFKNTPVSMRGVKNVLGRLARLEKKEAASEITPLLKEIAPKLENIKTVADLKRFRTTIRYLEQEKNIPRNRAVYRVYRALTEERSRAIKKAFEVAGPKNLRPFRRIQAEKAIKAADRLYADTFRDIEKSLPFKNVGFKAHLDKAIADTPAEQLVDRIFNTRDVGRLKAFKASFPAEFKEAQAAKVSEVLNKSLTKGEISPAKLLQNVKRLSPEARTLLFGTEKESKIKALEILINATPERIGPSGTPQGMQFDRFFNVMKQLGSVGKAQILKAPQRAEQFIKGVYLLERQGTKGRALGFGAVNQMNAMKARSKK